MNLAATVPRELPDALVIAIEAHLHAVVDGFPRPMSTVMARSPQTTMRAARHESDPSNVAMRERPAVH
jgi:hypothetical protein